MFERPRNEWCRRSLRVIVRENFGAMFVLNCLKKKVQFWHKLAPYKAGIKHTFKRKIFRTPSLVVEYLKSNISIGENWGHFNKNTHFTLVFFLIWVSLYWFSSIPINTTFQACKKMWKGTKISLKKTILDFCLCKKQFIGVPFM
jgi:hypothetical protein